MELREQIENLAKQLIARVPHIGNEEATKQSLIIPFIHKLGYDVFNPLEVEPEYVSDFGFKKGEKVDYVIKIDSKPVIFIEAKGINEKITKHSSQLYRYFNATPEVRFSILTNGLQYKFFTDLNQDNIMDTEPFYSLDMESLNEPDFEIISKLTKENFDKEELLRFAQDLVYMTNVNGTLKDLFKNPTDDFIRFLIKDINTQRVTSTVIDKFRPIIKKSINQTLLSMIGEGLSLGSDSENIRPKEEKKKGKKKKEEPKEEEFMKEEPKPKVENVVTTEEELKAFHIVKGVLSSINYDVSHVTYRDTQSYFNIINRVITKWFIRLFLDGEEKFLCTKIDVDTCKRLCPNFRVEEAPSSYGVSRVYFKEVDDLRNMKYLIKVAFDLVKE